MNKKSKTLELLDHIKNAPSFMGGDSRYTNVSNSSELWLEDIKAIEKELKVLNIIKKSIIFAVDSAGYGICQKNYLQAFYLPRLITEEEKNIVNEWVLENNKEEV